MFHKFKKLGTILKSIFGMIHEGIGNIHWLQNSSSILLSKTPRVGARIPQTFTFRVPPFFSFGFAFPHSWSKNLHSRIPRSWTNSFPSSAKKCFIFYFKGLCQKKLNKFEGNMAKNASYRAIRVIGYIKQNIIEYIYFASF